MRQLLRSAGVLAAAAMLVLSTGTSASARSSLTFYFRDGTSLTMDNPSGSGCYTIPKDGVLKTYVDPKPWVYYRSGCQGNPDWFYERGGTFDVKAGWSLWFPATNDDEPPHL
ncbi:hypothetical protein OG379_39455 [Streptomyces sp. NBC_01166]|uniref:hypothetical protein n=1 Tax=Streptomyces sp. NBC_01166 TaxID=2903755 RepID=UPI0038653B1D|nr:hypothetical protein OG379_39455 [Streptomyces sp. NBC_01166]